MKDDIGFIPDDIGFIPDPVETKPDRLSQIGSGLDMVFGGKKVGEAIGTRIAKMMVGPEAAQYVSPGPSAREVAGSALQSASLFFPVGRAAGAGTKLASRYLGMRAAKLAGNVAVGAAAGYGFDLATKMQDTSRGVGDVLTPGAGAAIGAAIPAGGAALAAGTRAVGKFAQNQAPRVINSLIKPLMKDFSYGKNPGRAVAEEGIVANTFDELETAIRNRRQEIGREIGAIGDTISTKPAIRVNRSLDVLDDAMKEAASMNNPTLLSRLQQVKLAITDVLEPIVDETGKVAIRSTGPRKLENLTFAETRDILRDIGDMTQFTGNPSDDKLVNSALKRIYGSIKEESLNYARKTNPQLAAQFEKLTEKYADLTSAEVATKYRDKILERQNLIGLSPQMAGIATGIITLVSTGGAAAPAVIAGLGGAALDKLLTTPGFKTRLAAMLSKKTIPELEAIFQKAPFLQKLFPRGSAASPGDYILDASDDLIENVKNAPPSSLQGGFARGTDATRKLRGQTADLTSQAKNYPTPEEFVKAQGTPVYHGSNASDVIKKEGFKIIPSEYARGYGDGIYFTETRSNAKGYGDVVEAYAPKNLKLYNATEADTYRIDTKNLIKEGYDGVRLPGGGGFTIFNPQNIKTRSQLIEIWKKANNK